MGEVAILGCLLSTDTQNYASRTELRAREIRWKCYTCGSWGNVCHTTLSTLGMFENLMKWKVRNTILHKESWVSALEGPSNIVMMSSTASNALRFIGKIKAKNKTPQVWLGKIPQRRWSFSGVLRGTWPETEQELTWYSVLAELLEVFSVMGVLTLPILQIKNNNNWNKEIESLTLNHIASEWPGVQILLVQSLCRWRRRLGRLFLTEI